MDLFAASHSFKEKRKTKPKTLNFFRSHTIFVLFISVELLRTTFHIAHLFPSLQLPLLLVHHTGSKQSQIQRYTRCQIQSSCSWQPHLTLLANLNLLDLFYYHLFRVLEQQQGKDIPGEISQVSECLVLFKLNFPEKKKRPRNNIHSLCYP